MTTNEENYEEIDWKELNIKTKIFMKEKTKVVVNWLYKIAIMVALFGIWNELYLMNCNAF